MAKHAIIDAHGNVVNTIELDPAALTTSPPEWVAPQGFTIQQSDVAGVGWTYLNGVFTAPPAQAPTAQQQLSAFISTVQSAINASDETMKRVQEAISLGTNSATSPDVVAFVQYRRALRTLLSSSTVTTLPAKPAYPAGT